MSGDENFPRPPDFPRLADAYNGDGFPAHGPWTPLSAAVLADALDALKESREPDAAADAEQVKAQTRAAKEIEAAWHDPHWLDGH